MNFSSHTFSGDSTTYIAPTWQDMDKLAFEVARQISDSGWQCDRVVTLAKGGWAMTRSLVDYLDVAQVASIGVKFYSGINQRLEQPEIYQDLPVSIAGEKLLLFDDVADSGHSLVFVRDYLLKHGAADVKTATLFYKPQSVLKPDFYAAQTSAWIVFQYELMEMARMLVPKWLEQGAPEQEVKQRLHQLGFSDELVTYYQAKAEKDV